MIGGSLSFLIGLKPAFFAKKDCEFTQREVKKIRSYTKMPMLPTVSEGGKVVWGYSSSMPMADEGDKADGSQYQWSDT